jgi:hypothetical protein
LFLFFRACADSVGGMTTDARSTDMLSAPLLVLIAGPYRSGTGDDPVKLAANLARLEGRPGRSSQPATSP